MKRLLAFIVYSNLWISAGASSFALLFYSLTDTQTSALILWFLFFSTLLTYTYQRFEKIRKNERTTGPRMEWMIRNKNLVYLLLVIGVIGTGVTGIQLSFKSLIYLLIMGLISFFYVFKIGHYNLRDLPLLKILLIGLVWAGSCFAIPYFELDVSSTFNMFYLSIAGALYIIAITIPFDIRDVEVDEKTKYTIPQIFGPKVSRIIALVFLATSCYLFYESKVAINLGFWIGISITGILIAFSTKNRKELFFSFGVDGLLIILGLTTYLFKIL